ncbi:Murein L,D-transpeptidase YcbB/YkuD [Pseudoxanthobacter soli DSM 19599]|uniref:Murein L,D-transpeptidase YcbB/YkuD n=1 Tax=Pseudoxanthobacter soli DSM 19599 TaxID=1123029 RepID=A0A1M7ZS84_9HYPH|nr:L,D-transpeptidase family protein [Pseudoxanthobacter soli]SHO67516.1 Murein L,D-transpeptidase YcbB/YkuD [Pseudoxanthobacter soli DSM 19599]
MRVSFRTILAGSALVTLAVAVPVTTFAAMPGAFGVQSAGRTQDLIAAAISTYSVDPVSAALRRTIEGHIAAMAPPAAAPADPAAAAPAPKPLSASDADWVGIAAFYSARGYAPVWFAGGVPTARTRAVANRLAKAGEDGLDPAAYSVLDRSLQPISPEDADRLARAELRAAAAILRYAREAQTGRVKPSSVSPLDAEKPVPPDPASVLAAVADARDPAVALDSYNPPYLGFRQLRAKLANLRAGLPVSSMPLGASAAGKIPSVGRVPALAVRDPAVAERGPALASRGTGIVSDADPQVTGSLPQPRPQAAATESGKSATATRDTAAYRQTEAAILANMERWRWLPRDLGRFHVWVDIPGYDLAVVRDGERTFHTRVVVGRDTNQTPTFSSAINNIVVNPYWNVPVSIVTKEMLKQIKANPGYLAKKNYEVLYKGQPVDPTRIVWNENAARALSIRQKPGAGNALGTVKFLFPNPFSVYLHDTPSKALFANDSRADSHGCVRVQNPMAFASALLAEDPNLNGDKVKDLVGGKERWLKIATPVPVHLTYFTAMVTPNGDLDLREDIYGRDARLKAKLGL